MYTIGGGGGEGGGGGGRGEVGHSEACCSVEFNQWDEIHLKLILLIECFRSPLY
jgi:hypothetical protein